MIGDERVRFCGPCQKNVYNLSAMASEEAESLLAQREGSICIRLYRREDGTVLTADCPVGVRRRRVSRAVVAAAGTGALAAMAAAAFSTQQGKLPMPEDSTHVTQGVMAPADTPTATSQADVPSIGSASVEPSAAPRATAPKARAKKPTMGKPAL
jgi:hypothetical protein